LCPAIAFLASLTIFFFPAVPPYLRYFAIFLLVSTILNGIENYLALAVINNTFFSNLTTVIEFTFYFYLLREIVQRPRAKKLFLYILVAYPILALMNIFLIQRNGFHTMTYALGCLLIIASCIYYFWELFQRPSSVNLGRQPAFWICSGLLFYYTCTFPIYGAVNLLTLLPRLILQNLLYILVLLNILLYLSFTIAFLCRLSKTRKSMSSF
jgi:hypothetical protein